MAIKEIKAIPREEKTTKKDMILNDVKEALDKGISKFEFVGDEYNYKHLCTYAKTVTWEWTKQLIREDVRKVMKNEGWKRMVSFIYAPKKDDPKYIHISSLKIGNETHVYCEINDGAYEWLLQKTLEDTKELNEKIDERERARTDGFQVTSY